METPRANLVANGSPIPVPAPGPGGAPVTLLQTLRGAGLTAAKESCGRGECGACTVLVAGRPVLACVTPAQQVDGEVTTAEGLAEEARELRARLVDHGASQCGFCTPAQVVLGSTVVAAARAGAEVCAHDVARTMSGVVCRCTGGRPVVDAVLATIRGDGPPVVRSERFGPGDAAPRVVGAPVRPPDWDARTSGRAVYASDVRLDGMLEAVAVRSPHPYAEVLGIDTSAALAVPGVRAVITAADFPEGARYIHGGGSASDRPPLATDVVRYIGQEVAAVAADTREAAVLGAAAVRVRYRARRAPVDVASARADGAARLHDRGGEEANVAAHVVGAWGDPGPAWAKAAHRVEGSFRWARQAHVPMEPQAAVARADAATGAVELWVSSQAPWFVAREVAALLGIDPSQVVCHDVAVGGGFGGKSKVGEHEVLAARLSQRTGRPVRFVYDRWEDFAVTKTRHSFEMQLSSGASSDGRIVAVDATAVVDNGAFNHYGAAVVRAGLKALGQIYEPDAVSFEGHLVDTATQPGGPFRGYGAAQVTFASEQQVDELAALAGADPLQFRIDNANHPDTTTLNGSRLSSARLAECLEVVRREIGWDRLRRDRRPFRGVGLAATSHGSGSHGHVDSNRSEAGIDIDVDGRVLVRFGGADAGTGQRTVLAQVAAELLGVDVTDVDVRMADLAYFDQGAWSSRGTHMGGHAAQAAGEVAARRLRELAAEKLGLDAGEIVLAGGAAHGDGASIAIGDLVALAPETRDGVLSVRGEWIDPRMEYYGSGSPTPNVAASYGYAVHAAEVEIDPGTGRITVLQYVAAHDIGRAINPVQVRSQIVGGVAMGLGAALSEELMHDHGRTVNPAYVHYGVLRAADLPDVRAILVEGHEPAGPFDAKSIGEVSLIPVAPAIANAVFDAIGVRFREVPITPGRVLAGLAAAGAGTRAGAGATGWRRSPHRWWVEAMRRAYPYGVQAAMHAGVARAASHRAAGRPSVARRVPLPRRRTEPAAAERTRYVGGATDALATLRQAPPSAPVRFVPTRDLAGLRALDLGAPDRGAVDLGAPDRGAPDLGVPGRGAAIGAAVTLAELQEATGAGRLPAVAEAVATIASTQLRTTATVGGNLLQGNRCWYLRNGFDCYKRGGAARPCYAVTGAHHLTHAAIDGHRCQSVTPSDLAAVFTALDGVAVVRGAGSDGGAKSGGTERRVPFGELYRGPGETVLGEHDLLVRVELPAGAVGRRQAFEKLALTTGDFSMVAAAVAVGVGDDGRWSDARVVLGAMAPVPWRARDTEAWLVEEAARRSPRAALDGLRARLVAELDRVAHPLERNGWKLDAAVALAERAARRALAPTSTSTSTVEPAPVPSAAISHPTP